MDEISINDLRSIEYSSKGAVWGFSVGQYLKSIQSKIHRIYIDAPHLASTGRERYVIEVISDESINPDIWKIIQIDVEGKAFVLEFEL